MGTTSASGAVWMAAMLTPATPPEVSAAPSAVGDAKMPLLASVGSLSVAASVAAAPTLAAMTSTETTTLPGATDTTTSLVLTPAAVATTEAMELRRAAV